MTDEREPAPTLTVSGDHGYKHGDIIEISGSVDGRLDGLQVVADVTSSTFTLGPWWLRWLAYWRRAGERARLWCRQAWDVIGHGWRGPPGP